MGSEPGGCRHCVTAAQLSAHFNRDWKQPLRSECQLFLQCVRRLLVIPRL